MIEKEFARFLDKTHTSLWLGVVWALAAADGVKQTARGDDGGGGRGAEVAAVGSAVRPGCGPGRDADHLAGRRLLVRHGQRGLRQADPSTPRPPRRAAAIVSGRKRQARLSEVPYGPPLGSDSGRHPQSRHSRRYQPERVTLSRAAQALPICNPQQLHAP